MKLNELMHDGLPPLDGGAGATEIAGLTADSRAVLPGWMFAALPGSAADGRQFIPSALEHGAAAILTTEDAAVEASVPVIRSSNPRRSLALMAAAFYGAQPETVAAITGTNGKTSVASFTRQIWRQLGIMGASMGTLGIAGPGVDRPGSLTTPDPVSLHADLAMIARARHYASGAGSIEPRPRPVPARRGDTRGRGLHQPDPRPYRLSRHDGGLSGRKASPFQRTSAGRGARRAECGQRRL